MGRYAVIYFAIFSAAANAWAEDHHFVVRWNDGTHTSADEMEHWGEAGKHPSIAERDLFAAENPARFIVDTAQPRRKIEAPYIELQAGDRICGRVVEFLAADESSGIPAHFIFEPAPQFDLPGVFRRPQIRVREACVRRIVAQASTRSTKSALSPNSLQTVEGGREAFRSLRWQTSGVTVLTSAGVKHFNFAELAAIELDRPRNWDAWLRQLAVLSPSLESPVMRMELADGTQLTTSFERLRPVTTNRDSPDNWFHLCQPAWSLDLIAVAHRQVGTRAIFPADATPLSSIEPAVSRGQPMILSAAIPAHCNDNLFGNALRHAGNEQGWGFAVHAPYELAFELPASARTFRTQLALDPVVQQGGCARGLVQCDGKTIYASPLLIGSSESFDSRQLKISGKRLALLADPAVEDRPTNADPFDIRDHLNWLEPTIEHDRSLLRRAMQRQLVRDGLAGWTLDPAEAGNWRLVNRLDELEAAEGGYRQLLALDGPVILSRRVAISSTTMHLTLNRAHASPAAQLEIWLDSNRLSRTTMPEHEAGGEPLRIEVPLSGDPTESAVVTVRLAPVGKTTLIDWSNPLRQ